MSGAIPSALLLAIRDGDSHSPSWKPISLSCQHRLFGLARLDARVGLRGCHVGGRSLSLFARERTALARRQVAAMPRLIRSKGFAVGDRLTRGCQSMLLRVEQVIVRLREGIKRHQC